MWFSYMAGEVPSPPLLVPADYVCIHTHPCYLYDIYSSVSIPYMAGEALSPPPLVPANDAYIRTYTYIYMYDVYVVFSLYIRISMIFICLSSLHIFSILIYSYEERPFPTSCCTCRLCMEAYISMYVSIHIYVCILCMYGSIHIFVQSVSIPIYSYFLCVY